MKYIVQEECYKKSIFDGKWAGGGGGGGWLPFSPPMDQPLLQLTSSAARMSLEICNFLSWSEVLTVGLKNAA